MEEKRLLECYNGMNIEVACNANGQFITSHAKLQRLVNVCLMSYVFEMILADPVNTNYVCKCQITDNKADRTVCGIGEVCKNTLFTESERNRPALVAANRAFDQAAIQILGIKERLYSYSDIPANLFFDTKNKPKKEVGKPTVKPVSKKEERVEVKPQQKQETKTEISKPEEQIVKKEEKLQPRFEEKPVTNPVKVAPEKTQPVPAAKPANKEADAIHDDSDITMADSHPIRRARAPMPRELTDTVLIGGLRGKKYEEVKESSAMTEFIKFLRANPTVIEGYPDKIQRAQAKFFSKLEI